MVPAATVPAGCPLSSSSPKIDDSPEPIPTTAPIVSRLYPGCFRNELNLFAPNIIDYSLINNFEYIFSTGL